MSIRGLELNLKIGCPIQCKYCPQDLLMKSDYGTQRIMSIENLKKILDNATHGNQQIEIFFAAFTEPLSVRNYQECIDICDYHPLVSRIALFSTGWKLDRDKIIALSKVRKLNKPNNISFHVNGKNNHMPGFDHGFWNYLKDVKEFLPHSIFIAVGFELDPFVEAKRLIESQGLKFRFDKIISRSSNIVSVEGRDLESVKKLVPVTCERITTKKRPIVMPDGKTVVCCNDYGCEMPIGNLLSQTWDELDFESIIKKQKNPQDNPNLPCFRDCHFAQSLATKRFL